MRQTTAFEFATVVRHDDVIVRDHRVHGARVMPGVTFVDLLYRGLAQRLGIARLTLKSVVFPRPVVTSAGVDRRLQLRFEPAPDGRSGMFWARGASLQGEQPLSEWEEHFRCEVLLDEGKEPPAARNLAAMKERAQRVGDLDQAYAIARRLEIDHRAFMKCEGRVFEGEDYLLAEVRPSALGARYGKEGRFALHPALLDASTLVPALYHHRSGPGGADGAAERAPYIPIFVRGLQIEGPFRGACHVFVPKPAVEAGDADLLAADHEILDGDGRLLVGFDRLTGKRIRDRKLITDLLSGRSSPAERTAPPAAHPPSSPELGRSPGEAASIEAALTRLLSVAVALPEEDLPPDVGFYDLGLDSTHLLELVQTLEERLAAQLYPTLLFEHNTIAKLAAFLQTEHGDDVAARLQAGHQGEDADVDDAVAETLYATLSWRAEPAADEPPPDDLPTLAIGFDPATRAELARVLNDKLDCFPPRRVLFWAKPGEWDGPFATLHALVQKLLAQPLEHPVSLVIGKSRDGVRADQLSRKRWDGGSAAKVLGSMVEGKNGDGGSAAKVLGPMGGSATGALGGYLRSLMLESPKVRATTVELDGQEDPAQVVRALLAEARQPEPHGVRYVGGARQVRELVEVEPPGAQTRLWPLRELVEVEPPGAQTRSWPLREGGTYLISGGGGALAGIVAEALARQVSANIVLVGRSAAGPELQERLEQLRKHGARVTYRRVDVTRARHVAALCRWMRETLGGIHGVIHTAGVLRDSLVASKSLAVAREVLAPKLLGASLLDAATCSDPLDFFVLFSSACSVTGNVGQTDYAYANRFLDELATEREQLRQRGERRGQSLSIGWPLWEEGGMQVDAATRRALRDMTGMLPMPTEPALRALADGLSLQRPQLIVLHGVRQRLVDKLDIRPAAREEDRVSAANVPVSSEAVPVPSEAVPVPSEAVPVPSEALPVPSEAVPESSSSRFKADGSEYAPAAPSSAVAGAPSASTTADLPADAIAIVGLSGQYPLADDLSEFWANLKSGRDCVQEVPAERWDAARIFDADPERSVAGKSYARWGGFLRHADAFDPRFFRLSPREAEFMDPQERLFLQCAWATVEDAGRRIGELTSRPVGVFVGVMWSQYQLLGLAHDPIKPLGASFSSIANRVSYLLDLKGPSLAVDTMCSSSLTAIHLACESIRRGECAMALAGGVNVMAHESKYVQLSQARMLARDGRCRAFGEGGSGYVPAEGVGCALLVPLADALAAGDPIYGVIRGSALNHGGRSGGFSVPEPAAQARAIGEALVRAEVSAERISYVETHGTGTSLGDPIEIEGLRRVLGSGADRAAPCFVGSVKSNIGHAESAAGIASLSKVLLQMKARQLVPSLHAEVLNPQIDFEEAGFAVQRECAPWRAPTIDRQGQPTALPRIAGISSFGAGGSNAHLIVQEAPARPRETAVVEDRPRIFVLSARDRERLDEAARNLAGFLERVEDHAPTLADVAYTLQVGREPMDERLAIVATTRGELCRRLRAFGEDPLDPGCYHGRAPKRRLREVVPEANGANTPATLAERAAAWAEGRGELPAPEPDARRASLPTYPFRRDRYWARAAGRPAQAASPPPVSAQLHPLVQRNVSTLTGIRFETGLSADDKVLAEHVVAGRMVLPAAAQLEMALAAGSLAGGRTASRVREVVWERPVFADRQGCRVSIALSTQGDGARFEIRGATGTGRELTCGRGLIEFAAVGPTSEPVDLEAVLARCPSVRSGASCYAQLEQQGLVYGPSFRLLEQAHCGEDEAVVRLCGGARAPAVEGCRLEPALADAALQAVVAVVGPPDEDTDRYLPWALRELELCAPLSGATYVWARAAGEEAGGAVRRFDVDLLDEAGRPLLRLRGLAARRVADAAHEPSQTVAPAEQARGAGAEPIWFVPRWSPSERPDHEGALDGALVLFDDDGALTRACREAGVARRVVQVRAADGFRRTGDTCDLRPAEPEDYERLIVELRAEAGPLHLVQAWNRESVASGEPLRERALERGPLSCFHLARALIGAGSTARASLLYLCGLGGALDPLDVACAGLLKSVTREAPQLSTRCVQLASAEPTRRDGAAESRVAELLRAELGGGADAEVRYDLATGSRLVRVWEERARPAGDAAAPRPFRAEGVYLITGGAGGLGALVATHLAREAGARLVLAGRSPRDARIERLLAQLGELGGEAIYVPADLSDEEDVARLVGAARERFGRIDGVFHAAAVTRDALLHAKHAEDFAAVLAPKVRGTLLLDAALAHEPLDCFVLFSSLSGVFGNVGQADYAYANAFQDAFAAQRERWRVEGSRQGATISIDWPWWRDGGISLSDQAREAIAAQMGLHALETDDGLRAFADSLRAREPQLAVAPGDRDRLRHAFAAAQRVGGRSTPATHPQLGPAPREAVAVREGARESTNGPAIGELDAALRRYLAELLARENQLDPNEIDPEEPLANYGFDSVVAMNLTGQLEQHFGALSKTLFFERPTIGELAQYFSDEHASAAAALLGDSNDGVGEAVRSDTSAGAGASVPEGAAEPPIRTTSRAAPRADGEPIAIVGVAGRYPQADDVDQFWDNLRTGRDCIEEIPPERWDVAEHFSPDKDAVGKSYSRWGGFLSDVDAFDPLFFKIAPRDAAFMDPQERLFLQTVWHTMEDAGYAVRSLKRQRVGVFVGVMWGQYQLLRARVGDGTVSPGSIYASVANRVSYCLDLRGPSMAVDTMCSSSLTALHLACDSLRSGDCEAAFAGGVNLTLHPSKYALLSFQRFAASDGRCRAFGEGGDGYVPGEGVGAVMLKRLSQAQADGDRIYAVIRGMSLNHGGKTNGFAVPNPQAQAEVISGALNKARVHPEEVSYVEAHGTGTVLGDPIEVAGLNAAFSGQTDRRQFCALGSVKSNIGHLEAAAGIAALTKVLLQMKHGELAPSIHTETLNPHIDFSETPLTVQRSLAPWEPRAPRADGRRIAAISAFGAGGANAHVVLEQWSQQQVRREEVPGVQVVPLSAKTGDRLVACAERLLDYLESDTGPDAEPAEAGEGAGARLERAQRMAAELLGVCPEDFDATEPLVDCGLDEVGFAQLLRALDDGCELEVDAGLWAERPSLRDLLGKAGASQSSTAEVLASGAATEQIDLADLAFTLQVGRDQHEERVAFVVRSVAELRDELRTYIAAASDGAGATAGVVARAGESAPATRGNEQQKELVQRAAADGRWEELARLWATGATVDWSAIARPVAGRRIALPGYPFAKESYWIDEAPQESAPPAGEPLAGRSADPAADATREKAGVQALTQNDRGDAAVQSGGGEAVLQNGDPEAVTASSGGDAAVQRDKGATVTHGDRDEVSFPGGDGAAQLLAPEWVETPLSTSACDPPRSVLVVTLARHRRLARAIARRHPEATVRRIVLGSRARKRGRGEWEVDARDPEALRRFIASRCPDQLDEVVLIAGEPVDSRSLLDTDEIDSAERRSVIVLFRLIKALRHTRRLGRTTHLRVVGCGAYAPAGESTTDPFSAALFGLTSAAAKEYALASAFVDAWLEEQPRLRRRGPVRWLLALFGLIAGLFGRRRGMGEGADVALAEAIGAEPTSRDPRPVVLRNGQRWQLNLRPYVSAAPVGRAFRHGGVYLIAGGATGIGLELARHLATVYAAKLVLLGRRPLAQRRAVVDELERAGAEVSYCEADITQLDQVRAAVERAVSRFGALHGVVHSAAELQSRSLETSEERDLSAGLLTKIRGSIALYHASATVVSDVMLLFSSAQSFSANPGQASYAAGNAFQDAYARLVDPSGARVKVMNWGYWGTVGAAASPAQRERFAALGVGSIEPEEGLAALEQLVSADASQLMLFKSSGQATNDDRVRDGADPGRGRLDPARSAIDRVASDSPATAKVGPPAGELDLRELALGYVKGVFGRVLGVPEQRLHGDKTFEHYGVDSLAGLEIVRQLEEDLGPLSSTLLFEHNTLDRLAELVAGEHAEALTRAASPLQPASDEVTNGVLTGEEAGEGAMSAADAVAADAPAVAFTAPAGRGRPAVHAGRPSGDIAIVGLSARYPGAEDVSALVDLLTEGRDAVGEIPADRWDWREHFASGSAARGQVVSRWGGFLDQVDAFDPLFFGITPREAEMLDPQERLFLEACWTAVEDAGYTPRALGAPDRQVGVFAGVMNNQYEFVAGDHWGRGIRTGGSSRYWSIANRVSYLLDLQGPSLALDTACSSSLVALHLACESIRRGECQMALAGGVNLILHPKHYYSYSAMGMLSRDGRCRPFGADANGIVLGEGVGVVLLKPLDQAERDGDPIYALVKGSAMNAGGKTGGYTVPNPTAQAALVRRAMDNAGVDPSTVGYVEAHGTGTELGDPIEIAGLRRAFEPYGVEKQSCAIGSLKSNVGHLEAAAGIAGLTKVVLQLKLRTLFPSLHAEQTNPKIAFDQTPFVPQTRLAPWNVPAGQRRRAAISSFGAGGTNAHVVLEEYPVEAQARAELSGVAPQVVVLSAANAERLREYGERLLAFVERPPVHVGPFSVSALAQTLQQGRCELPSRLALVASTPAELATRLRGWLEGHAETKDVFRNDVDDEASTAMNQRADDTSGPSVDAATVARRWVEGQAVRWEQLHGGSPERRIAAPTYPFARERYWLSEAQAPSRGADDTGLAAPFATEPLASAPEESTAPRQGFRRTFAPNDEIVRDHLVGKRPLLPAAVAVEMALAAGEQLLGARIKRLRELQWRRPLPVLKETELVVSLSPEGPHAIGDVPFTLCNVEAGREVVWAEGMLAGGEDAAPAPLTPIRSLRKLKRKMTAQMDREGCYARFDAAGLHYGETLRTIERLWFGAGSALALLQLPEPCLEQIDRTPLHPSLLDGALQSVIGAVAGESDPGERSQALYLPTGIGEVELRASTGARCYAHATLRETSDDALTFDLDLLSEAGEPVVLLRRLMLRRVGARRPQRPSTESVDTRKERAAGGSVTQYYRPAWVEEPARFDDEPLRTLLLLDDDDTIQRVIECNAPSGLSVVRVQRGECFAQLGAGCFAVRPGEEADYEALLDALCGAGFVPDRILQLWSRASSSAAPATESGLPSELRAVFALSKVLLRESFPRPVRWVYATPAAPASGKLTLAAVAGLLKSAWWENPRLIGKTVEVDTLASRWADPALVESLLGELLVSEREGHEVRLAGGKRFGRQIEPLSPTDEAPAVGVRSGGAYLVTGGLGQLGSTIAAHLARTPGRVRLALTGVSPLGAEKRDQIRLLERQGATVSYHQCDLAEVAQVRKLADELRTRYGALHGVVHCAGVRRDGLLRGKSLADLEATFAAKASGALALDEALAGMPTDFWVLASSLSSLRGNGGQAGYAAANRLLDALAERREQLRQQGQRQGKTVSINWPLWQSGGMQVDAATLRRMEQKFGLVPLDTEAGLKSFDDALALAPAGQLVVIATKQESPARSANVGS